jgi:hypothetical protein
MKRFKWLLVGVLTALTSGFFTSGALAHWADLAVAEVTTTGREVRMTITYPTGLTAFADDDKSGSLSSAEIAAHKDALRDALASKIQVTSGGQTGVLTVSPAMSQVKVPAKVAASTHTTLTLSYAFENPIDGFSMRYELFVPNVSTASCLTTILQDGKVTNVVFTPENREYTLRSGGAPVDFRGFVSLGIEHILTGYDHLLFLLALLSLGGGLGYLLKVITAFTVAHSVTLALTTLGIVNVPGKIIESGIALSIAYVAAENLFRRNPTAVQRTRWIITFVFGLLHGMGFADILHEMSIPKPNLLGALVGFNLGVELGQLTFVLPAFVLLGLLERWRVGAPVRWVASAFAVAAGLFWFVQRAFLTA